jgi:hypothetical protein
VARFYFCRTEDPDQRPILSTGSDKAKAAAARARADASFDAAAWPAYREEVRTLDAANVRVRIPAACGWSHSTRALTHASAAMGPQRHERDDNDDDDDNGRGAERRFAEASAARWAAAAVTKATVRAAATAGGATEAEAVAQARAAVRQPHPVALPDAVRGTTGAQGPWPRRWSSSRCV